MAPQPHIYDHAQQKFLTLDEGASAQQTLLTEILIELRVHTQYLQAMNLTIVDETPEQLRIDQANDPSSLTPT